MTAERITVPGVRADDGEVSVVVRAPDGGWMVHDHSGTSYWSGSAELRDYLAELRADDDFPPDELPAVVERYDALIAIIAEAEREADMGWCRCDAYMPGTPESFHEPEQHRLDCSTGQCGGCWACIGATIVHSRQARR